MLQNLLIFQTLLNDAPEPWQIGFQDSAAPGFTGIVELHNTVFFYLILICIGVFWMLGSIMYFYSSKKSPIVHKYLNHGSNVPIKKYINNSYSLPFLSTNSPYFLQKISYYSFSPFLYSKILNSYNLNLQKVPLKKDLTLCENFKVVKLYENAELLKKEILFENKGKSGIYL